MDLCSIVGRRELTDIMRGEHMNTNADIFQCRTEASTGERNQLPFCGCLIPSNDGSLPQFSYVNCHYAGLCIKETRTFIRSKRNNRVIENTISSKGCFLGLKKGECLE